jgi:MFS family permease
MEAVSQPVGRARALHAFRSRNFRLLWGGQTVSLIGNAAFLVAVGWRVVELTGSAGSLALVLLAESTAMLATLLVGGALADRYSRRSLMIVSDLSRCAIVTALAFTDATGHLNLTLLIVFAIGVGLGDGFFYPAFGGMVPLVVEQPLLASANALIGISRNTSFIVGPALAAGLYDNTSPSFVFGFDAGTFVFSAALLWLARPREIEPEPREGTVREIVSGFRYVAGVPWLWVTIGLAAFILMIAMAPYQSLLPKLVREHFELGVGAYGFLFTVQAVGMVVGTFLFGQWNPRRHRVVITYTSWALNDLCVITLAILPWYGLALALVAVRGFFIAIGIGIWETVLMELVPESKLARVVSLDFFGSLGLTPVGYALTALVSGFFSPSEILVAGFSLSFLLWLAPLASRRVRTAA